MRCKKLPFFPSPIFNLGNVDNLGVACFFYISRQKKTVTNAFCACENMDKTNRGDFKCSGLKNIGLRLRAGYVLNINIS